MGKGGCGRGPPPAPDGYGGRSSGSKGKGVGKQDWRARAAEAAASQAAEVEENKPWRSLKAKTLPSGPIDDPRWETAFDAEVPDEGTTRSVIFLATLAGSYCIKASLQPAEEYFASKFMQQCGCQTPAMRVLFRHHPEYQALLGAIQRVAELVGRRRDEEKMHKILMVISKGLAKPQLFIMSVVPKPETLTTRHIAEKFLALPAGGTRGGSIDSHAARRLQALGRVWFAHALLGFRDCISFHPLMEVPVDHHSRTVTHAHLKRLVATIGANPDNLLLTAEVISDEAGMVAIDSHMKHISGEAQHTAREAQALRWSEFIAKACEEQRSGVVAESCLEFLRDFVLSVTGGQEGDAQLYERFLASIEPQVKILCTLGIWPPSGHSDYYNMLISKLRPGAALQVLDGDGHDITPLVVRSRNFYGTERELQLKYPVQIVDRLPEGPCNGEGFVGLCKEIACEEENAGPDIGYRLTDAELAEVRVGVLRLIREIALLDVQSESEATLAFGSSPEVQAGSPAGLHASMPSGFSQWIDAALAELEQSDWSTCDFWNASVRRIDFAMLRWYVDLVRDAAQEHRITLDNLPPLERVVGTKPEETSCAHWESTDAEARFVGAATSLWRALPVEIRLLLRKEGASA